MTKLSRRDALIVLAAPACAAAPAGLRAVWDLDKAFRESTPARERVCINGLWRWQPAAGPRITDVKVETSVRRWQITVEAELEALNPGARYTVRAVIQDGGREVARIASRPFTAADLVDGRIAMTERWRPEKRWDTDSPNQYELSVALAGEQSNVLDQALPVRFGFREFWIEGRDFF